MRQQVTQERLRELLQYDEDTGIFTRRVRTSSRVKIGDVAGSLNKNGYVGIRVDGTAYYAHRLAWLYVHGRWPPADLDHSNGQRSDNRIANLRECTRAENLQNQVSPSTKKSGLPMGVFPSGSRCGAQIHHDGKRHYLGLFDTPELAHAAYLAAKAVHHAFQPFPREAA